VGGLFCGLGHHDVLEAVIALTLAPAVKRLLLTYGPNLNFTKANDENVVLSQQYIIEAIWK
jgi:hypothetical protein